MADVYPGRCRGEEQKGAAQANCWPRWRNMRSFSDDRVTVNRCITCQRELFLEVKGLRSVRKDHSQPPMAWTSVRWHKGFRSSHIFSEKVCTIWLVQSFNTLLGSPDNEPQARRLTDMSDVPSKCPRAIGRRVSSHIAASSIRVRLGLAAQDL